MPLNIILNLPYFEIEDAQVSNIINIKAKYTQLPICPYCSSNNLRIKDSFTRVIRHIAINDKPTFLHVKSHKFKCNNCGKYFNQRFLGVLKYKRSTETFRKQVFKTHSYGVCQSTLSSILNIGQATVERWYKDFINKKGKEVSNRSCPIVMGIDEHFFSRRYGFATTICDLKNHSVFDITLGRSEFSLEKYFLSLRDKDKVRVVVMDLSETYRSSVVKHFKNAKIVADRFHVIRLINHHFLKVWQELDPSGRKNKGLLSLIRRHEENLKEEQRKRLYDYLTQVDGLLPIYQFKQKLVKLMLIKTQTKRGCKKLIPIFLKYIDMLKSSFFQPLVTLGKTLESWMEEVIRMWRFSKSNSITEGFHNKMEMISRRAFGFKNFNNYKMRVIALCA